MSVSDLRSNPSVSRTNSVIDNQSTSSSLSSSTALTVATSIAAGSPPPSPGIPPSPTRARSGSLSGNLITKFAGASHGPRRSLSGNDALLMIARQPSPEGIKDGVAIIAAGPTPSASSTTAHDVQLSGNYEDYDIRTPIGYGSSAVVYTAIYKPLQKRVAIKMIDLDAFERNQIDEVTRETQLMALSKHPNVLRVYGSFVHGSKLYIVTPFLAGGSCLDIMKNSFPDGFDEISIATILKQALEGLIYFHKNGHIHRDVKAGNLLMDEDGTVLLADFGVSSSCIENGERGVRRTFVGTPCWMAPEVMEQAGYNFKADIWSFGITAIELATGHAPFARYPPFKVLMMTVSNDPPTLDREHTKNRYTKSLKDMIDLCLQKDPTKRPTAEKLLQHPFFKQAKKKDYLVRALLAGLLPLEQRPHKRAPQKHNTLVKTSAWNFGDEEDKSAGSTPDSLHPEKEQSQNGQPSPNTEKKHIRFDTAPPASSMPHVVAPTPEKKHISFSESIVKNMVGPGSPPTSRSSADGEPKRSRFVVEDGHAEQVSAPPPMLTPSLKDGEPLLGLGMANTHVGFVEEPKRLERTMSMQSDGGVVHRKGRFSVTEGSGYGPRSITPGMERSQSMLDIDGVPLPRVGSTDSFSDRRSRFEVSSSQNAIVPPPSSSSAATSTALATAAALVASSGAAASNLGPGGPSGSRESSSSRDQASIGGASRESSLSRGRFSVEKDPMGAGTTPGGATSSSGGAQVVLPSLPAPGRRSEERDRDSIETPSCGVGKRGRFTVKSDAVDGHSATTTTATTTAMAASAPIALPKDHGRAIMDDFSASSSNAHAGGGSDASSQSGSMSGSPSTSPSSSLSRGHSFRADLGPGANLYNSLETLIRQNEQQRALLSDLFLGISADVKQGTLNANSSTSAVSSLSSSPLNGQMLYGGHWGTHFQVNDGKNGAVKASGQEDVHALLRDNETLRRENEALRRDCEAVKKELDRLRRSMSATSINVSGGATSNAAAVVDGSSSSSPPPLPPPILVNGTTKPSSPSGSLSSPGTPNSLFFKVDEKTKE